MMNIGAKLHLVGDSAEGALVAARWVRGRTGWFTMRDVLGIDDLARPNVRTSEGPKV